MNSASVLVMSAKNEVILLQKSADTVRPIASITKLMMAMVALDAKQPAEDMLEVTSDDVDTLRNSRSKLTVGTKMSRKEMLQLALMSSENRAAHALSRAYPGGSQAFIHAMNVKAVALGLSTARFYDPTGLTSDNVASAHDLARMVIAASKYPLIREFTTEVQHDAQVHGRVVSFVNTNPLVRTKSSKWKIQLSKTGFINEAGHCLVMLTSLHDQPTVIVLLDSTSKNGHIVDAIAIKRWASKQS